MPCPATCILVAGRRSPDTVLSPSKDGFVPGSSPYSLLAFRIRKTCLHPNRRNLLPFKSLPLVSRLFQPSVSCPACSKPNDFDFRYCQRCVFQRQSRSHQTLESLKAPIDLRSIKGNERRLWLLGNWPLLIKNKEALWRWSFHSS